MIRHPRLQHLFVKQFPEYLEPGVLYVSLEYGSAAHSCCCGCGEEVVTPITPTDWKLIYDGESVSLWPSIGNWKLRCRSHYVIDRGAAVESLPWNERQIAAERRRDQAAKQKYYAGLETDGSPGVAQPPPSQPSQENTIGLIRCVALWFTRRWRK